ncbi:MAG: toxin-antitoxin system YwqK family antitoxin [Methanophagales archaeon]|nr:toxin-antitoxin system YwqK family antitoxin [Methanophagales archaeon]
MNKIKLILVGIIIILLMPTTVAGLFDSYRTTSPITVPADIHNIVKDLSAIAERVYRNSIQPETRDDAVAEIEKMIKDGEPRWEVAKRAATIADLQITNMNDPLGDTQIWHWLFAGVASIFGQLSPESCLWTEDERKFENWRARSGDAQEYDYVAEWVWENRVGQCSENADLVYYLLKEAGVEDVRIHNSNRADHGLVVWGMGNQDPSKPESWTDEVIIPDSWQHYVLRGKAAFNNEYAGCTYDTDITQGKDPSACGYGGRPCCKKIDPCRSSTLICVANRCRGCGYEGKYCCKDEKCNEGLECNKDGMCVKKEKDTSAGDTSAGEFDCPIPKGAEHAVTGATDQWLMPDRTNVGPYREWHGVKRTIKFVFGCYTAEGKKQGVWRRWYEDGSPHYVENYKDGKLDGVKKNWYASGKTTEENYKDGKKEGVSKYYEYGILKKSENYKDGKLDWYKYWREDGTISSECIYEENSNVFGFGECKIY